MIFIIYILCPVVGSILLLMALDKRMKLGTILVLFWCAFKGETPEREVDRRPFYEQEMRHNEIYNMMRHDALRKMKGYEKVNWKEEGF